MGGSMGKLIKSIVVVIGVIIGLLILPFATIWSINTLFPITIPYTIETFLATYWLLALTQLKEKHVPIN
jgi:hypothetical protein